MLFLKNIHPEHKIKNLKETSKEGSEISYSLYILKNAFKGLFSKPYLLKINKQRF